MTCIEVTQEIDLEVAADQTVEIIASLIGGILIAVIIIAIILIIRCRRVIIRMMPDKCSCCCCCIGIFPCCVGAIDDDKDTANAYLIHSWGDPELEQGLEANADAEMEDGLATPEHRDVVTPDLTEMEMDESLVLTNPGYSEFTLDTKTSKESPNQPRDTNLKVESLEDNAIGSPSSGMPLLSETTFTDDSENKYSALMESTGPSLADVFIAPKGNQNEVLNDCEKRAILKLESGFLQNWEDFFLLLLDTLVTNLVTSEQADEKWKGGVLSSCKAIIDEGQKKFKLKAVAEFGSSSTTDTAALEMVGFDVSTIKENLIENIYFNLKETEISAAEAEEIMTDFEEGVGKFEVLFSKIYLQEVVRLQNRMILKELLTEKLMKNTEHLISEMKKHQKKHFRSLEKIQMDSSSNNLSRQNSLAPQVKKIWAITIKKFEKDFNKQKYTLRDDLNQRMDKKASWGEFREATKAQKEELLREEITVIAFIDFYCSKLQDVLNTEDKQEFVEINFTATEFNALIEILGIKKLKKATQKEKTLYSDFTSQAGWVPSDILQLITQLTADLDSLQASLRAVRQQQESEVRVLMNTPALGPPLERLYLGNMKIPQNFIPKIVEIQVDLSETEQESLKEKVEAQLKCYEVQFEISKLKYEQKLRSDIKDQRLKLSTKRAAKLVGNLASDSNIKAAVELDKEGQNMESAHKETVEVTKRKLLANLNLAKKNWELLLQQRIERIRRGHENDIAFVNKQEKALNTLKSKLLERISDNSERERLLQEYQINLEVLDEEIQKSKKHQEQVLLQKIEARKLEKMKEKECLNKKSTVGAEPYKAGTAKRFAANCLVSLLMEVRHKQSLKGLEDYHVQESEKLKSKLQKRYDVNTKLSLQLHESEMIMKLASALNMSRQELEKEIRSSSLVDKSGIGTAESLLSKGILDSYGSTKI